MEVGYYCRGITVRQHKETNMLNEDQESRLQFNQLTESLLNTKFSTLLKAVENE